MKFVINSKSSCKVRVRFINSMNVRLLLKINSNFTAFFSENQLKHITKGLLSFLEIEETHLTVIKVTDLLGLIEIEILVRCRSTQASTLNAETTLAELIAIKQKIDSSFAQSAAYVDNRLVGFFS